MLRLLVLLLVLANAGYFAWTRGALAALGFAPITQSEPQRIGQQIRPGALRLQSPVADPVPAVGKPASPAVSVPPAITPTSSLATPLLAVSAESPVSSCLQVGLFDKEQTAALRSRLQSLLPAGSWMIESSIEPARWVIYMGRYADKEAVDKKKAELRQRQIAFQPLDNASLEPGLSLGSYGSQLDAEEALARISQQGVRTARVVQSKPELHGQRLKFPAADSTLRNQLDGLKPALLGKPLLACR